MPTLLKIGPMNIYSYGVFLFIALFVGLFIWWRMGRDENLDEGKLFDFAFVSIFTYFVVGRAVYALISYSRGMSFWQAVALLTFPGVVSWAGILAVVLLMMVISKRNKWKLLKISDILVVTLSLIIAISSIGAFLNGSNPGKDVIYLGVMYPGFESEVFPIDLLSLIWFGGCYYLLGKIRKNFRFYKWYLVGKHNSNGGLASMLFIEFGGLYYLIRSFLDVDLNKLGGVSYMTIVAIIMILTGLVGGYVISGRDIREDLSNLFGIFRKNN